MYTCSDALAFKVDTSLSQQTQTQGGTRIRHAGYFKTFTNERSRHAVVTIVEFCSGKEEGRHFWQYWQSVTVACQMPNVDPCKIKDVTVCRWFRFYLQMFGLITLKGFKKKSPTEERGVRDKLVQPARELVRQLTGVKQWAKWRVMAGLDWQAQWPPRLMKGAIGRQMRAWWEGTHQMEWWTKRSKFGPQHERESYSVCCDHRNESYFEVVPRGQEAFQL